MRANLGQAETPNPHSCCEAVQETVVSTKEFGDATEPDLGGDVESCWMRDNSKAVRVAAGIAGVLIATFIVISLVNKSTNASAKGKESVHSAKAGDLIRSIELSVTVDATRYVNATVFLLSIPSPQTENIIFSHGMACTPGQYAPLLEQWVRKGYVIYAPVHVDSPAYPPSGLDTSGNKLLRYRMEDMEALAAWLRSHTRSTEFVGAGHSFGASTALFTCGAYSKTIDLPRPAGCKAAVALSPAFIPTWEQDFGSLAGPALLQTGTLDSFPGVPWQAHTEPFFRSPPADKYLAVFQDVDHYFGNALIHEDRRNASQPSQERQLNEFVQLSSTFLDAHAALTRDDLGAQLRARAVLEELTVAPAAADDVTVGIFRRAT